MPYISIRKGLRIWYKRAKPRRGMPTLFFIHGWVHNHTAWEATVRELRLHGYGTLVCDLPGHGRSSSPAAASTYRIPELARICATLHKRLRVRDTIVIGHSLGGMVAQYLGPLVNARALVLVSTTYRSPLKDALPISAQTQTILDTIADNLAHKVANRRRRRFVVFHKDTTDNDILTWIKGASATDNKAILACFKAILSLDSRGQLASISCPVLAIAGTKDNRTPIERCRKMCRLLGNARLVSIQDGRHNLNLIMPKRIASEIHHFVQHILRNTKNAHPTRRA